MQLSKDIDFSVDQPNQWSNAYLALLTEFSNDPVMDLLSANSINKLAQYLVKGLREAKVKGMYRAASEVQHTLLPRSPYGTFGNLFASHVAGLVQKGLYPNAYKGEF